MTKAPFGIVGSETAFTVIYAFCKKWQLDITTTCRLFNDKPAQTFDLPYGKLEVGSLADLTIII